MRQRLGKAHAHFRVPYNLRHRPLQFNEGDKLYRKNHILSDATNYITSKLVEKYVGPFTISKKLSSTTYKLTDENNRGRGLFHLKDLKAHSADM